VSDEAEVNWEAPLTSKHRALELLAWMLREEFGCVPIAEIIRTWGPLGVTERDVAMVLDVFPYRPAPGDGQP
jgi:hypothetical protein